MRLAPWTLVVGIVATISFAPMTKANDATGPMVLVPDSSGIKWGPALPSLPKGVQIAVLAGDPSKPGPFVLRVKAPANTTIAPHTHGAAENLTVISGVLYHGMGETLDKGHGRAVGAGGFVFLPANMAHSVWTTNKPAELQVTGTGPFEVRYINAADDPSFGR